MTLLLEYMIFTILSINESIFENYFAQEGKKKSQKNEKLKNIFIEKKKKRSFGSGNFRKVFGF